MCMATESHVPNRLTHATHMLTHMCIYMVTYISYIASHKYTDMQPHSNKQINIHIATHNPLISKIECKVTFCSKLLLKILLCDTKL